MQLLKKRKSGESDNELVRRKISLIEDEKGKKWLITTKFGTLIKKDETMMKECYPTVWNKNEIVFIGSRSFLVIIVYETSKSDIFKLNENECDISSQQYITLGNRKRRLTPHPFEY